MTWIAEDLPAYAVFPGTLPADMSAEDYAMSATKTLAASGDLADVCDALAANLHKIANMHHIQMNGQSPMYRHAASMFESCMDTVRSPDPVLRINNRVYRIRKES